jgi:hypothetical protein
VRDSEFSMLLNRRRRRRRLFHPLQLITCFSLGIFSIGYWNYLAIWDEREAPLDHLLSIAQKPWQSWNCPKIPKRSMYESDTDITFPPVIMISARPWEDVAPIFQSWKLFFHNITLFPTRKFSVHYTNQRCRKSSWKSRLFAVYQHVLSQSLLKDYPTESYVVIVEDDVRLLDGLEMKHELSWAARQQLEFYSFRATSLSSLSRSRSCLYEFGMTAVLLSRKLVMKVILGANDDTFCRLPIDMAIARDGPWYVTTQSLTQHIGNRTHV